MNQTAYGDPVGGFNAAAALIVALLHQQRTGAGQNVDLSQVEAMLEDGKVRDAAAFLVGLQGRHAKDEDLVCPFFLY